eukprot:TRINITY_DN13073_c0_g6_i1.p2 TRINITY_DN13073_c0_g6~~TRINITY_DN13073_c0_g6_i1.p2  ORF type:complete len:194 (+),score=27.67 TRINITY_DN13073_c0_g6_i1:388-969(+)
MIEKKAKVVADLSEEIKILDRELKDVKVCLSKASEHHKHKKELLDFREQSATDCSHILKNNTELSISNRKLLDAINNLKTFGKTLAADTFMSEGELHKVIAEHKALKELSIFREDANAKSRSHSLKKLFNDTPSRNNKKTHKPIQITAKPESKLKASLNPYECASKDDALERQIMALRLSRKLKLKGQVKEGV